MTDYSQTPFTEIATFIRGVSYDKNVASVTAKDGYIPILRANNIQKELILNDLVYVPSDLIKEEQMIREGDIVLAMSSGSKDLVGKSAQANTDINAAFGTFCGLIRAKEGIDSKYLGLYFQTQEYRNFVSYQSKGVNICNLKKKDIETLQIPLPPLPTQRTIVARIEELFAELDKAVEKLKTDRQQLKTYRQAVLNHWLNNEDEKWEMVKLGEVIDKPTYGTSKKCDYEIAGTGVLRIPNIGDGYIIEDDLKFALFSEEEKKKYSLKEDDLLTIRSNGSVDLVGKCALISCKEEKYLFAGYLIRLRPNKEKVNPKFLLYTLESHNLRVQIEEKAKSTSGVNNINSVEIQSLQISIPPLPEQQRIVAEIESRLSACESMEQSIAQSLAQAEVLRQSILKKAFSGELV